MSKCSKCYSNDVNEKKEKTYFDYPVILDKLKDENIRRMQIDDDDD